MRLETAVLAAIALMPSFSAFAAQPEAVLKLEPYRRTVAIRMEANGTKGLFTFDTAGGGTVVSPAFAKAAGCVPWGQIVGYQMHGTVLRSQRCDNLMLSSGGYSMKVPVASVFDVTPLISKDAEPVDGLLALDVFAGRTITIDFAAGSLTIETPESARERIQGARELPMHLSREDSGRALAALVDVPTPKGMLRFELDSGNGGTLLVAKPYAALFGLDPDAKGLQNGVITLAPGIVARGMTIAAGINIDGNLGMPFLKDWAVTLDLAAGRLWLKPSAATPPPGMGAPPPPPKS